MAYAEEDDLLNYISEAKLASLTSDTDEVDDDVVDQALADASAEIDGYIGKQVNVPLVSVPARVLMACIDIALYRLFMRREDVLGEVPKSRKDAYDAQISWLKMVARNEATLGVIPQPQATNPATTPEYDVNEREFTKETMGQW